MTLLRVLRRFPLLHRLFHWRRYDDACIACRYVWRTLERDPAFVTSVNAGLADIAAGRVSQWRSDR